MRTARPSQHSPRTTWRLLAGSPLEIVGGPVVGRIDDDLTVQGEARSSIPARGYLRSLRRRRPGERSAPWPITFARRIRTRTGSSPRGSGTVATYLTARPPLRRWGGGQSRTRVGSHGGARGRRRERRRADREPRAGPRARSTDRFRAPRSGSPRPPRRSYARAHRRSGVRRRTARRARARSRPFERRNRFREAPAGQPRAARPAMAGALRSALPS